MDAVKSGLKLMPMGGVFLTGSSLVGLWFKASGLLQHAVVEVRA